MGKSFRLQRSKVFKGGAVLFFMSLTSIRVKNKILIRDVQNFNMFLRSIAVTLRANLQ